MSRAEVGNYQFGIHIVRIIMQNLQIIQNNTTCHPILPILLRKTEKLPRIAIACFGCLDNSPKMNGNQVVFTAHVESKIPGTPTPGCMEPAYRSAGRAGKASPAGQGSVISPVRSGRASVRPRRRPSTPRTALPWSRRRGRPGCGPFPPGRGCTPPAGPPSGRSPPSF